MNPYFDESIINLYPDPGFESGVLYLDRTFEFLASPLVRLSNPGEPIISGKRTLRAGWKSITSGITNRPNIEMGVLIPWQEGTALSAAVTCGFVSADVQGAFSIRFVKGTSDVYFDDQLSVQYVYTPTGQTTPGRLFAENLIAPTLTQYALIGCGLRQPVAMNKVNVAAYFDDVVVVQAPKLPAIRALNGEVGGNHWLDERYFSPSAPIGEADSLRVIKDWMPPMWYEEPT